MIVFSDIIRMGYGAWRWLALGTGPFRIYDPRVGSLIAVKTGNTLDFRMTEPVDADTDVDEPPPLEVLDASETEDPQTLRYPTYAIIQWRGNPENDHYRIERWVNGAWKRQTRIKETGEGYYQWRSLGLADGETHRFRVIAVDSNGGESNAAEIDFVCCRNPEPARWKLLYDNNTLVLTAAIQ